MKRFAAAACAAATLALGTAAPTARAANDDGAAARALAAQLVGDAPHRTITAEAIARCNDALERATRMRQAGDPAHAKVAEGLALEWAETARDLVRAVDAEAAASEVRHKAIEAQAQLDRTRALVEEGVEHVGRLQAELEEAEHKGKPDRVAVEVHDDEPRARRDTRRTGAAHDGGHGAGKPQSGHRGDPGGAGHGGSVDKTGKTGRLERRSSEDRQGRWADRGLL